MKIDIYKIYLKLISTAWGLLLVQVVLWIVGWTLYCFQEKLVWTDVTGLELWRLRACMFGVLLIITILSLFPAFLHWAFNYAVRRQALMDIRFELRHYKMHKLLKEAIITYRLAFNERTFTVPIILATLAMAIGWALVFFGTEPAFVVIEKLSAGGMVQAVQHLPESHPVVFGFLGAFTWFLGTIFHRYVTKDMKPSVFMYLATRTWTVFIITVVLGVLIGKTSEDAWPTWLLATSFVIGIYPKVGIELIKGIALGSIKNISNIRVTRGEDTDEETKSNLKLMIKKETTDNIPLTRVQGLNLWHQTRLEEEDIDSVQNLSQCDIVGLMVNTRLGLTKLLDWINQALLILYVGESNLKKFHKAGIRTATGFENNYAAQLPDKKRAKFEKLAHDKKLRCYMGKKGISWVPDVPEKLADSLGYKGDSRQILRNTMMALCDNDNYQRLWLIIHGELCIEDIDEYLPEKREGYEDVLG